MSVRSTSTFPSLNREYHYTEVRYVYRGSAPYMYILLQLLLGKRMLIVIPGIPLYRRLLNQGSTECDLTTNLQLMVVELSGVQCGLKAYIIQ